MLIPRVVVLPTDASKIGLLDRCEVLDRQLNMWMNIFTARQRKKMDQDNALIVQFEVSAGEDGDPALTASDILGLITEAEVLMEKRLLSIFPDLFAPPEEPLD